MSPSSKSSSGVSPTATARLKQDYARLKRDPVPFISAEPLPSNILEWHYVVEGPPNSPYQGGYYHGKLIFPREFPFRPPSIYMITPSGRFKVNSRLCLSISDFHPDTWNPAWCVSTILTGLLSFMLENTPTFGSLQTTDAAKRHLAAQSIGFNLRDQRFLELFPELADKLKEQLEGCRLAEEQSRQSPASSSSRLGNHQQSPVLPGNAAGAVGNDANGNNNNNRPGGPLGHQFIGLSNIVLIACLAVLCFVARSVLTGAGDAGSE